MKIEDIASKVTYSNKILGIYKNIWFEIYREDLNKDIHDLPNRKYKMYAFIYLHESNIKDFDLLNKGKPLAESEVLLKTKYPGSEGVGFAIREVSSDNEGLAVCEVANIKVGVHFQQPVFDDSKFDDVNTIFDYLVTWMDSFNLAEVD